MKDEIKDIIISIWVFGAGIWTRFLFGGKVYTKTQKAVLILFGIAIVIIVKLFKLPSGYSATIGLLGGLWCPNIVSALIKAGNDSEDSVANSIKIKIKKYFKNDKSKTDI